MKNIIAGGNVQAGNITNNNFSSNPKKVALRYVGAFFVLLLVVFTFYLSVDFNRLLEMNIAEQTLTYGIFSSVGFLLFKLGMFPVNYEIELWDYKRNK